MTLALDKLPTPLTDALLAEYPLLAVRPMEPREKRGYALARSLEQRLAMAVTFAQHQPHCAKFKQMPTVEGRWYSSEDFAAFRESQPCSCGLDAFLALLRSPEVSERPKL